MRKIKTKSLISFSFNPRFCLCRVIAYVSSLNMSSKQQNFIVRIQPHSLLDFSKLDEKKSLIVEKISNELGMRGSGQLPGVLS